MNLGEIVDDSLRYPLSDLKKLLFYGFISLFTTTAVFRVFISLNGFTNLGLITIVVIIELFVSLVFTGYFLKIIKYSLRGNKKLPDFKSVYEMFKDGIKVFLVGIVYLIPVILLVTVFAVLNSSALEIIIHQTILYGFNPVNVITVLMDLGAGIGVLIAFLYMIITLPVFMVSITSMANKDELSVAFRFHEIINKIGINGWVNLISWYLITGLVFLSIFFGLGFFILGIFGLINNILVGELLITVVLIPYLYMYFARSSALFYISDN